MNRPGSMLGVAAAGGGWLARRPGPVQLVDDALLIVRRATLAQLVRGWLAGLPCAAMLLLFYYCERVEGFHTPRLALAAALVLVYWLRFRVLASLARSFVQTLRPSLPLAAALPWVNIACSASISALGLWLWCWPLLGLGHFSVFATLALLPFMAVRGAIAPSFLARAGCCEERGWTAFARAVEDSRGARAIMLAIELLLTGGFMLLFGNLYALGALLLVLANSVLGLDVGFVVAFLSPDNEFVPLVLLGVTIVLLDPLRAAFAALAFSEARGRNEGADLHAAIDALAGQRAARSNERVLRVGAALALLFAVAVQPATVTAQALDAATGVADGDQQVRLQAKRILARGEFHEFDTGTLDGKPLWQWLERWFGDNTEPEPLPTSSSRFELRVPAWTIVVASLVLLAIVGLYLAAEARKAAQDEPVAAQSATAATASVPPHAKPADLLADAAALARAGQHRDAVRVLYAASLVALDRLGLIRFDSSRTNGHYVRSLPAGVTRELLSAFTADFEHGWYGRVPVTQADYERAKDWADALCQSEAREP